MANGVNKVILVGHLGKDPEQRYTPGGTAVTKFSIATTETWGKGDARKSETEWHNIVVWDKLAEICGQYLQKGKQVYIEGKIKSNKWEDKEGNKRTTIEIVANVVNMLGSKNDDNGGYQKPTSKDEEPGQTQLGEDEDVPF